MALARSIPVYLCFCAAAFGLAPIPEFSAHVVDRTGVLASEQQAALERRLSEFEARKGAQIAVLIVPTVEPEAIEQYSIRVAEKWKVGREKPDDGAILLVALEDRIMRIEVGHGLEGALPDVICKRIISDLITPYFKQGNIPNGIGAGVDAMIKAVDGEALPEPPRPARGYGQGGPRGGGQGIGILFFLALVAGTAARAALGRLGGGFLTGGIVGLIGAFVLGSILIGVFAGILSFLFVLLGNSGGGRRWGGGGGWGGSGGSWGGGGWSSGGGGGFSGGGGGSFGGGGASGRW